MWVINPAVGACHYFPPGLQLPPRPLRGLLPILLLGEQRHNGCEQFAPQIRLCWPLCAFINYIYLHTVTRQRRDCDLNPGPSATESSTLYHSATEPPITVRLGPIAEAVAAADNNNNNSNNCELYFRSRLPNACSHRRCERDFIFIPTHFCHATTPQHRVFTTLPVDQPDL